MPIRISDLCIFLLNSEFLLLPLLLIHGPAAASSSNATDRDALLLFRARISGDPLGLLTSWNDTNTSVHFCSWHGVSCADPLYPHRVTALSLPFSNLTGFISPYLANLTFLQSLNLSNNFFRGSIPPHFGRLANLQYLDMQSNFLEGDLPPSLTHCSKLVSIILTRNSLVGQVPANFSHCLGLNTIDLMFNQLSGTIPESLTSLPALYKLRLNGNNLTGNIPASLGNLSSLSTLDLYQNSLQGRIPSTLGRLSNLTYLGLAVNNLSGELPSTLFNISSIVYFQVGNNLLSGELPQDLGTMLPNLRYFYAFVNQLGGRVPSSLANATRLRQFVLDGNMFVGTIPGNLGSLQQLTAFQVGQNQLEAKEARDWEFLTSLSNCSSLSILYLTQNNLQGLLPSSATNLSTQLTWLAMAENQISGNIPMGIGRYSKLTVLDFSANLLSGTIPATIGMLRDLQLLHLPGNELHGEIPTTITNLTQLSQLLLAENKLEGSIPSAIGALSRLTALDLSDNRLNGTIPGQAIGQLYSLSMVLNLSHNLLTGSLPTQIGSLINLVVLDVSENRLSGEIPGSLGSCQLLGSLFMQGNSFTGIIPSTVSKLAGIQELDLSRNNLSGQVPEFLGSFRLLNRLNLSFNELRGPLPDQGVFRNASAISVIGNDGLCGGDPQLHLHPCGSIEGVNAHRSSSHLKLIIPLVISSVILVAICAAYFVQKQTSRASPPKPSPKEPFFKISYAGVHRATSGFSLSNLIGAGSFGSVYKGIMESDPDQVVAIKVLNLEQQGAYKSFMSECDSLRAVRHRNLLNIVTICSSIDHNGNEFKALIFEYMPNGSLDDWLHPKAELVIDNENSKSLSLVQRWNIVMDVAMALDYLHHQCESPIVHCDLKPGNVLLDSEMSARVSDFGLSRFLHRTTAISTAETSNTIGIRGSIGYIAPGMNLSTPHLYIVGKL